MATETRIWPDIAIPSGETLAETLEAVGMTQAELANRMGRPPQAINEIIRGTKAITPETAIALERVLGVPAHVWIHLEAGYRYTKARIEDRERVAREVPFAAAYPYAEMAKLGWVRKVKDRMEQTVELLRFFGVTTFEKIPHPLVSAAYRRSEKLKAVSTEALQAWLREGERRASRIEMKPFDADKLRSAVGELRAMTLQPPKVFQMRLPELLADCGVAWVVVPHLARTGAHGATRWLGKSKVLVLMSLRGKWADIFWHTLFHELAHVLNDPQSEVFIEFDNGILTEAEKAASSFAANTLIDPEKYRRFMLAGRRPTRDRVLSFAAAIGIAPGIVVGRLQHDRRLPPSHLNDLRMLFDWAPRKSGEKVAVRCSRERTQL
jgi:HTH-type transcriptional regulator/antitoxin HigA